MLGQILYVAHRLRRPLIIGLLTAPVWALALAVLSWSGGELRIQLASWSSAAITAPSRHSSLLNDHVRHAS